MLVMLLGVGNLAWADSYTITFETGSGDGTAITTSTEISKIVSDGASYLSGIKNTVSKAYYSGDYGVKLGTSSANGILDFTLASSVTPTSVVIKAKRYKSTTAATIELNDGSAQSLTSDFADYTFDITAEINHLKLKSSKYCWIKSITVNYGETPSGPVDPEVSFASGLSLEVGGKATNEITKPTNLTVTYSSSNTNVATVNATTGEVTGVAAGNASITASWDAVANTYTAGSASYTVTVNEPVPAVVYEKVTNKNQLVAGNEYILVSSSENVAMGAQSNTNYRGYVTVAIANDEVSITNENVAVLTLGGSEGAWTFLASDNSKYLGLSSNNNYLQSLDEAKNWEITSDFQLKYTGVADVRYLQYNATSGQERFACYKSGQKEAYLFVKEGYAIDNKENASVSIDVTSLTVGGETALITAVPEGLVMSYESSAPSIASVENGVVTGLGHGSATITVSWEEQTVGEKTYNAGSSEFEISVVDPNAPGTQNNPYTVAQALENTPSSGNSVNVYIKGIVSKFFKDDIISDGSNYRYYISDDGSTNSQLLVYKGKKVVM